MKLSELAWLARLAYKDSSVSEEDYCEDLKWALAEKGLSVTCFGCGGTEGYIAYSTEYPVTAYVVFRGTEKALGDIATDLRACPTQPVGMPYNVHSGVFEALQYVMPQVRRKLNEIEPTGVYWVGHSLGGMLATLAALYLPQQVFQLVTFGSPAVGDRTFKEAMESMLPGRIINVVNPSDPIPHLWTPWICGYRKAGILHLLDGQRVVKRPSLVRRAVGFVHALCEALVSCITTGKATTSWTRAHSIKQYHSLLVKAGK